MEVVLEKKGHLEALKERLGFVYSFGLCGSRICEEEGEVDGSFSYHSLFSCSCSSALAVDLGRDHYRAFGRCDWDTYFCCLTHFSPRVLMCT
jgi:hypothetical protein